ncbi:YesL family protein [Paenarthrobacter sp. NPDC057981]|uniref:YesL family protein n=1 Tax=Paenarthrobacter sp. NPDC057981 TaxID=3346297 RepID=UPI0036D833C6
MALQTQSTRHSGLKAATSLANPVIEWIWRLSLLNLLWIGLTLAGGVVFGLFPATSAVYIVMRKWFVHPETRDQSSIRAMTAAWRNGFWRANALGWALAVVAALLAYALWISSALPGIAGSVAFYGMVIVASMFCAMLIHLPFVAAHVEAGGIRLIRAAWMLALAQPFATLAIAAVFIGLSYLQATAPALLFFASLSPLALVTTMLDLRTFSAAIQRQNR